MFFYENSKNSKKEMLQGDWEKLRFENVWGFIDKSKFQTTVMFTKLPDIFEYFAM